MDETLTFTNSFWKIPTDFSNKYEFPELNYINDFLKGEKALVKQIGPTLAALDKAYRSQAVSFSSQTVKTEGILPNTLESVKFANFVNTHFQQSVKFFQYAQAVAKLKATQADPLKESFNNHFKILVGEITKLRMIVQTAVDELHSSYKGYPKYFSRLQQACSALQTQPGQAAEFQFQKAISAHDNKLKNMEGKYITFHQKWIEYCASRDELFSQIDVFIEESGKSLTKLIDEAEKIDIGQFDPSKIQTEYKVSHYVIKPAFYGDEKPKKMTTRFMVTVDREIEVSPSTILTPKDIFEVVSAVGDEWTIKDRTAKQWNVPSEYLVPK